MQRVLSAGNAKPLTQNSFNTDQSYAVAFSDFNSEIPNNSLQADTGSSSADAVKSDKTVAVDGKVSDGQNQDEESPIVSDAFPPTSPDTSNSTFPVNTDDETHAFSSAITEVTATDLDNPSTVNPDSLVANGLAGPLSPLLPLPYQTLPYLNRALDFLLQPA